MTAILRGKAGQVDLVLEEDTLWDPVLHNLADDAVDQDGEHEPFEEYSVAYLTAFTERGGDVMFRMGPADDALDGVAELDADAGLILLELPRAVSVGLPLEAPRYAGWYVVEIDPGGDPTLRTRYLEGKLIWSRRGEEVS